MSAYIYLSPRPGPLAKAHAIAKFRRSIRLWLSARQRAYDSAQVRLALGVPSEPPKMLKIPLNHIWSKE